MDNYDVLPLTRNARIEAYHFSERLAKCLSVEKTLKGHRLCVNRLAWNRGGTHLLSGSDDKRILMYAYPNYDKLPLSIATEHTSNIFGVQFLPHSGDAVLISGAMDSLVQIHRLDAAPTTKFRYPSALDGATANGSEEEIDSIEVLPESTVFSCHHGRVKDVEVEESSPFLFWSVSEDGTLRQFDVRCDFGAQARNGAANVLVGVRSQNGGETVELKGLDINQACPHMMAVACGDPYVRIFDRRKLTLSGAEGTFPEPVMKLSPPHLPMIGYIDEERCHSTYVHFSHSGDKIVSLFHGDHAYAFDISSDGTAACTYVQASPANPLRNGHLRNGECSTHPQHISSSTKHQEQAQEMFNAALRCELEGNNLQGLMYLEEAIRLDPRQIQFYNERAGCLIKRKAPGDLIFALKDTDQAIALDPTQSESYFCRCQAIDALGQIQTAQRLLRSYVKKFPEKKRSEPVVELRQKIAEQLGESKKQTTSKRSRETEEEDTSMQEEEESGGMEGEPGPSHSIDSNSPTDDLDCDEYLYPYYCKGGDGVEEGSPEGIWWKSEGGRRLLTRFAGHRNVLTDIKECTYLGHNDALVACGSDGGHVFIYNAETGDPVNVILADEDVCNCVQGHPTLACLATSGIESVIRLWTPTGDTVAESAVLEVVEGNLEAMKRRRVRHSFHDPMLMRLRMMLDNAEMSEMVLETTRPSDDSSDDEGGQGRAVDCRMV